MANNTIAIIPQHQLSTDVLNQFAQFGGQDDLDAGVSGGFPHISIRGAKWRMVEGGAENPIYMPGTRDLAPAIKVVIMRSNPHMSKTYYEGAFVEGSDAKPDCYSNNGVAPEGDAPKRQSDACASCPKNVWGSKISPSGAKIKACADVRRVAVLPADDLGYSPALLRIPGASLSDLAQYGKALKARGIPYGAVVTKMAFDADAAFPKITFQFDRMLTPDEMNTVVGRLGEPIIDDILGLTSSRAPAPALPAPEADKFGIPADVAMPTATQATPQPAADPAPEDHPELSGATAPKKGKGFGAAPAEEVAAAPAPAPAASTAMPSGPQMMADDIEAALADLKF